MSSKAKCQRRLYPYKHGSVCIWGNASSASIIRGEISVCKYVGLCMSHMWEAAEGIVLNSKLEEKNSLLVTLFSWNVCRQAESGRVYLHTITLPNTCWSCVNSMILKLYIHCKKNSAIWNLKLSIGQMCFRCFFFFFLNLKFEFNFSAINQIMAVFRYVTRSCFCNCAFWVLGQHCFPCHCLWEVPHAPSLTHNPPMKPKRRTKNKMMNKIAHHLMSTYSSQLNKHSFVF